MTAQDLVDLLAVRYSAPAWAFLPQVRNGTGHLRSTIRTADALAMSLYPSRGIHLHGFEIKVNRGDWLRELKDPEKAEDFIKWCDFWWIVAPKGLVELGELPAMWGLIVLSGRGLKTVAEAQKQEPQPMDRLMLAGIMRRLQEVATPEAKVVEAERRGEAKGEKNAEHRYNHSLKEHQRLQKIVQDFERVAGIAMDKWSLEGNKSLGKAVNIVLAGEDMKVADRLLDFRKTLAEMMGMCDRALNEAPRDVAGVGGG
jgi:hypothetical protein